MKQNDMATTKNVIFYFPEYFGSKVTTLFSTKTLSYYKTSFKFKFSLVLWPNVTNKIEKAVWLNVKSEKRRDPVSPIPLSNMHWEEKNQFASMKKVEFRIFLPYYDNVSKIELFSPGGKKWRFYPPHTPPPKVQYFGCIHDTKLKIVFEKTK